MFNINARLPGSHSANYLDPIIALLHPPPVGWILRPSFGLSPMDYHGMAQHCIVRIVDQPENVCWDSLCDTHIKPRATCFSVFQASGFDLSNREQEEHPVRWDTRSRVRASDTNMQGRGSISPERLQMENSAEAMPSSLVFGWP